MGWLRKNNKRDQQGETAPPMPDWAAAQMRSMIEEQDFSFFSDDQWSQFAGETRRAVERLPAGRASYDGGTYVTTEDGLVVMLENIARSCHEAPQDQWGSMIDEFLSRCTEPLPDEWSTDHLRVRLLGEEPIVDSTAREWALGLLEELCFEFNGSVHNVSPVDLSRLGVTVNDAYDIAWRQTLDSAQIDNYNTSKIEYSGETALVTLATSDRLLTSSLTRELPRFIDPKQGELGPNGALFSVPSRGSFVYLPVDVPASLETLAMALFTVTQAAINTLERPLSPQLYWWHDGHIEWLPLGLNDDGEPTLAYNTDTVQQLIQRRDH